MKNSLLWRALLIVVIVGWAALNAWPPKDKIKLGLDLRGGMYLVLNVEVDDALRADRDKAIDRILSEAKDEGIDNLTSDDANTSITSFRILGATPEQVDDVEEFAKSLSAWKMSEQGGVLAFELESLEVKRLRDSAVTQAIETIRRRVDAFGVAEPVIQRQSGERIVLQLPGVDDPERVKDLIGEVAFLEFRMVDFGPTSSEAEILANYGGAVPNNIELLTQDQWDDITGERIGTLYYGMEKRPVITGRDLKGARPSLGGNFNEPVVQFQLSFEAGKRFGEVTGANVGRFLGIVLDDKVVSAPRLNSQIYDSGVIEGGFSQQEVEDLSMTLQSGALPAKITFMEERTVGPSLGQDSIEKGVRASLLGGSLVLLAMLVVYKRTGINAVLALTLNIVLVFGALASFGAMLTLPGIAGIILTIGMAVDANVLIFERIKEELRSGRSVTSAIDNGFGKAISSVMDANLTTLLAAIFLYNFGTGPIRGFAVTLSVGILASLFTAVFISRWIFDLGIFLSKGTVEKLSI